MLAIVRFLCCVTLSLIFIFPMGAVADTNINVPILCYHNFNPVKPGSMNLTPQKFEGQMKYLKDHGFTIIPLQDAVEYLKGTRTSLPSKAIVITVDDGWESAYDYLLPIVQKYKFPVTLFVYPETISTGKHSLTWDQLAKMQQTGLFNIQGHTYSHPNFKQMKKRLSADAYEKFVTKELVESKKILEEKTGTKVTLLAWPFGIYDDYLEQQAAKAGYVMAFTIDYRTANKTFKPEAQPRFMIIDAESEKTYEGIVNRASS